MKTKSKTRGYIIRSAAYAVFAIQFVVVISVHAQVPQIIGDENIDLTHGLFGRRHERLDLGGVG